MYAESLNAVLLPRRLEDSQLSYLAQTKSLRQLDAPSPNLESQI